MRYCLRCGLGVVGIVCSKTSAKQKLQVQRGMCFGFCSSFLLKQGLTCAVNGAHCLAEGGTMNYSMELFEGGY